MGSSSDSRSAAPETAEGVSEQALREARLAKAARVRARGGNPFSNDVDSEAITDIARVRAGFDSARQDGDRYDAALVQALVAGGTMRDGARVAGRIVAMRTFGKAAFLRLRDRTGEIQVFCRQNLLGEGYARLEDLDVADHVQAAGQLMVTKTAELSVEASSLELLTKAYRPPPEKWHGLSDVEVRYRRRYLDLMASAQVRAIFGARACVLRALRSFLDERGFLEVETPSMTTLVGGAAARPFTTHHNALGLGLFLRIAPELYLKRLVVGGLERVYEIGRCYRNEGLSTRHNPEFTMLELYRAYATYETLMGMTETMLRHVDAELERAMPEEHGRWLEARPFRLDAPFARETMHGLLRLRLRPEVERRLAGASGQDRGRLRGAGLTPEVLGDPPGLEGVFGRAMQDGSLEPAVRKQLGACENHGERVFLLYELLVEPNLPVLFESGGKSVPVFVTDHPVEVSPLARRQSKPGGDPRLVDRFELFVHGRELCNAFSELNDPEDQAERFREQVAKKARGAEETMDYDEDYVRALEHGLPPTAGFGMGVDRLTMMLTAQDSIREVILFPLMRPER
jgi:lysyl-tRNA synthetase class 2